MNHRPCANSLPSPTTFGLLKMIIPSLTSGGVRNPLGTPRIFSRASLAAFGVEPMPKSLVMSTSSFDPSPPG